MHSDERDQVAEQPFPRPNKPRHSAKIGMAATVLAVAIIGAACSSSSHNASSTSASTEASTAPPSSTTSIGDQPCLTQSQPPGTPGAYSQGNGGTTFTLTFSGCNWSVTATGRNSPVDGTWTYSAATNEITFTEREGLCGPVAGTYKWAVSGNNLTMTLVSDTCAARTGQFDGRTWNKTT